MVASKTACKDTSVGMMRHCRLPYTEAQNTCSCSKVGEDLTNMEAALKIILLSAML
jgi:hypothetical protein